MPLRSSSARITSGRSLDLDAQPVEQAPARVVTDDHYPIPGHATIEFHGADAELNRAGKSCQGIFAP